MEKCINALAENIEAEADNPNGNNEGGEGFDFVVTVFEFFVGAAAGKSEANVSGENA